MTTNRRQIFMSDALVEEYRRVRDLVPFGEASSLSAICQKAVRDWINAHDLRAEYPVYVLEVDK